MKDLSRISKRCNARSMKSWSREGLDGGRPRELERGGGGGGRDRGGEVGRGPRTE